MSISGVQGLPLEVAVVACYNLDDNHWISKQNPFVTIEYGNIKYRTKQCKDGRKNPSFQGKFIFTLIEGLQELNVEVWNYKKCNEQLGTGRVLLNKVISQGFEDASWSLHNRDGKHAGEIRLILRCPHVNKQKAKLDSTGPAPTKTLGQLFESKYSSRGAGGRAPAAICCSATRPTTPPYSPPSRCTGTRYPPPNTTNSPPMSLYPCTGYPYPPNVPTTYPPSPNCFPTPPAAAAYPPPHTYPPPPQLSICYPTGLSVYPPPPPPSLGIYPPPQPQGYPSPPY